MRGTDCNTLRFAANGQHYTQSAGSDGERRTPNGKDKGSALVYDIKRITEKKPVDKAYDALKELPGVVEMNGQLTLGGQGATVILDGQVTNLTKEQFTQVLKSVPKDRLADVEIMYNKEKQHKKVDTSRFLK